MARYRASIETLWTPDEAFAYLSDFSTTAEWDPGVVAAERVGAGAIGEGTEFRLVADSWGERHRSPIGSSNAIRRAPSPS